VQQIRCAAAILADQLEESRALEAAWVTWPLQSAVTQLGDLNSNFQSKQTAAKVSKN
jgi:hypothetical protein